jgi:hypothetical protein
MDNLAVFKNSRGRFNMKFRAAKLVLILISMVFLVSCFGSDDQSEIAKTPWDAYNRAVITSKHPTGADIYRNLSPVSAANTKLIWNANDPAENRRVLVSTWASWPGYSQSKKIGLVREVWVTLAPEVKDILKKENVPGSNIILRIDQLLGMPPTKNETWFVELWARPADLFRPAKDPEIEDAEAGLDFPPGTPQAHINWFNDQVRTNTYPWTRLGYTYDWGNPATKVGVSEYIIRVSSEVEVNKVVPTLEYLN